MSNRLSGSSLHLLDRLMGTPGEVAYQRLPAAIGPTIVKVRDPLEDPEAVVELLDAATPAGRRANRWLKIRKQKGALGVDSDGRATLHGRRCCLELSESIDSEVHRLRLPAQFTCTCGTLYEVRMQAREERFHGR